MAMLMLRGERERERQRERVRAGEEVMKHREAEMGSVESSGAWTSGAMAHGLWHMGNSPAEPWASQILSFFFSGRKRTHIRRNRAAS